MIWFGFALYSVPAILSPNTGIHILSVRIVNMLNFTFPPKTEEAVGLSFFVVLFVGTAWYFQLRILRRGIFAQVGGRGQRSTRIRLGAWRWPARAMMLGYVFVAAVLPTLALLLVAVQGYWSPKLRPSVWSFESFRQVLYVDTVTGEALRNSLLLATVGATVAVLAAAMLALFFRRRTGRAARVVDGLIRLPATISSIIVAVGFILAFTGAPFYLQGTVLILLLAYITLLMPQAAVIADAAAAQIGAELDEASRIAGASAGRTFRRVQLPLMLPGLVAGWSLVFVLMAGDLTVSAMLASPQNNVVGFRILEVYANGAFGVLAALALLMTLISGVVVTVVLMWSRRRGGPASSDLMTP